MKALLLNGAEEDDRFTNQIGSMIMETGKKNGWQIDNVLLRAKEISSCKGCFYCWIKTPGQCIIKDDAKDILKKIVNTDLLIYLTPITFGGYSYHLKKVLDRSIGIIMPFFRRVQGEVHHQMRYEKYPFLLGVGVDFNSDKNNSNIFTNLIERNSLNFEVLGFESKIIRPETKRVDIQNELNRTFKNVEELI